MKKSFLKFGMGLVLGASIFATSCSDDDSSEPTTPLTCDTCDVDPGTGGTVDEVEIITVTGATGTTTWTKDNIYVLDGLVFVEEGTVLTIEAGTIIKGNDGAGTESSALVVAMGGKIMANGTASEPIIFTSIADNITKENGVTVEGNVLTADNNGLWGGVIVLGKAPITNNVTRSIEGIDTKETRAQYGGNDVNDNSGVLSYISIRHGGTDIGEGNEINGLTLGGVGAGTTIQYVEVYANADDGIEFFGGTAQVKYAVVTNCGDESFDYDEGWSGKGQFWFTSLVDNSDRAGEHDGGFKGAFTALPESKPEMRNVTYVGHNKSGKQAIVFKEYAGGTYKNMIITDFEKGVQIEDLAEGEGDDCRVQLEEGDMMFDNVSFQGVSGDKFFYSTGDVATHSNIKNVTESENAGITAANPVPASQVAGGTFAADDFFQVAAYRGAFDGSNWAQGWTKSFQ